MCGVHAQILSAAELSAGDGLRVRPEQTCSARCGRSARWSRRSAHAAPCTCCRPPTCRCGQGRSRHCPRRCRCIPMPVRFTDEDADLVIAAIGDALADAELTVDELTEAIVERTGPWAGERTMDAFQDKWPRWRQLTSTAAHRGVLCFGPNKGRSVTYTNPHRWLPGFRPDDGRSAMRALVTAYLHAYGPATASASSKWLSIRRGAAAVRTPARMVNRSTARWRAGLGQPWRHGGRGRAGARGPAAAVLRRVRRRRAASRAALPRDCRDPRALAQRPGRQLPGAARRRRGRRRVAPASDRVQAGDHRRAAARSSTRQRRSSTTRSSWSGG